MSEENEKLDEGQEPEDKVEGGLAEPSDKDLEDSEDSDKEDSEDSSQ